MLEKLPGPGAALEASALEASLRTRRIESSNDASERTTPAPTQADADRVTLSDQAKARLQNGRDPRDDASPDPERGTNAEERQRLRELRARDREVRSRETAQDAVAGRLAPGSPRFQYEIGPDGRRYAVSGGVNVRIPPTANPEDSIQVARQAFRAATAPSTPSVHDRVVARQATSLLNVARQRLEGSAAEQETGAVRAAREAMERATEEATAAATGVASEDRTARENEGPVVAAITEQTLEENPATRGRETELEPRGGADADADPRGDSAASDRDSPVRRAQEAYDRSALPADGEDATALSLFG